MAIIKAPQDLSEIPTNEGSCCLTPKYYQRYPEPTFWTVYKVYVSHKQMNRFDMETEAYGKLTFRGEINNTMQKIPNLKERGWNWLPCNQWLQFDPTQRTDFKPSMKKYDGRSRTNTCNF